VKEEFPKAIYSLLKNHHPSIRVAEKNTPAALPLLLQRLPKETNDEIQFKIFEEIARQDIMLH
jgi:hypothetical protein